MPVPDGSVAALAAGPALAVALLGAGLLWALRRRSLQTSIALVAGVSVLTLLAGSLSAARAMLLSPRDFEVLLVVIAIAGGVGLSAALLLGRMVSRSSRALSAAARGLGEDGSYCGVDAALPRELAAVEGALVTASSRLAEARQREQALERSRRELVAWVSHDLRTPLAGIRAMSEALEDGVVADPETVARYHRAIGVEADRLAEMVNDLFELSRIHAHAVQPVLQRIPLADLVSDALASAAPVAAARGVRLTGDASPDGWVEAGLPELGRVLGNLLANAIRHTPAGGVVHVAAGTEEGGAWLTVQDACGGIPPADLPRLFDVAFRGTAARTPGADGGAGLGLAIARGLVQAHHGDISLANAGPGCRVLVRLPVAAGGSRAREPAARPRSEDR